MIGGGAQPKKDGVSGYCESSGDGASPLEKVRFTLPQASFLSSFGTIFYYFMSSMI